MMRLRASYQIVMGALQALIQSDELGRAVRPGQSGLSAQRCERQRLGLALVRACREGRGHAAARGVATRDVTVRYVVESCRAGDVSEVVLDVDCSADDAADSRSGDVDAARARGDRVIP